MEDGGGAARRKFGVSHKLCKRGEQRFKERSPREVFTEGDEMALFVTDAVDTAVGGDAVENVFMLEAFSHTRVVKRADVLRDAVFPRKRGKHFSVVASQKACGNGGLRPNEYRSAPILSLLNKPRARKICLVGRDDARALRGDAEL